MIPNVRLNGRESVHHALAGIPFRSTLALGLHGCTKLRENRSHVIAEIRMICELMRAGRTSLSMAVLPTAYSTIRWNSGSRVHIRSRRLPAIGVQESVMSKPRSRLIGKADNEFSTVRGYTAALQLPENRQKHIRGQPES